LTWEGGSGTNHIREVLDGCAIEENFDGTPSMPLKGMSLSVYNPTIGKWQQTWIDTDGSYLPLTGEFANGEMVLSMERTVEGKPATNRMVFYNIAKDTLDWNWERSTDGGLTWELLWKIHYQRQHG
jgi:hypothetical protein